MFSKFSEEAQKILMQAKKEMQELELSKNFSSAN